MIRLNYDVVIIGSGFGGLTAAALLTKAGYKTLVLEKLPDIGGRCSSYNYKGYILNSGALWVLEDVIAEIWGSVDAPYNLAKPTPQYMYRIKGKNYEMPPRGGLFTMMSIAANEGSKEPEKIMQAIKQGLSWQEPSSSISFKEWLNQYSTNPVIHGIFQGFVSMSIGIGISDLPAKEYFQFMKHAVRLRDYGYARGGLKAVSYTHLTLPTN